MTSKGDRWSMERGRSAQRVAAALYGVVAIMSAELAVKPGEFEFGEVALGAILVGLAVMLTKVFYDLVKKETEIGAHLPLVKVGAIVVDALPILLFPFSVAVLIGAAALMTPRWTELLDLVLYAGIATIFAIGFLSSYVLDNAFAPAVSRGVVWMLFGVVLVIAKKLA